VARGVDDVDAVFLALGRQRIAVFFDRMVMPRSFSMSPLSMTRSVIWCALVEGARLLEQLVDQGGLAVIDVGDDGDIAQRRPPSRATSTPWWRTPGGR
jgi:hypothetical protein